MTDTQLKALLEDKGIFDFEIDGFKVTGKKGLIDLRWDEIDAIIGYKVDLMTTDEIWMHIFMSDNSSVELNEEMPGWHLFNKHLFENLPAINEGWQEAIMLPAFATNTTLLYDRKNRSLADALKAINK